MKVDSLKVVRSGRVVLDGLNAQAMPGQITGVLGPNAAGKTTLLRTMVGLLKPDAGTVRIDGDDVFGLRAMQRARRIALVPQRFRSDVPFAVHEVVAMGARQRGGLEASDAVRAAIEACQLTPQMNRPFTNLSVGQQQRVVIARALAQISSPGVLVLDEPLAALDLKYAATILDLLRERAAAGDTVIMSLHDLGLASAICDQAWLLDQGRLVAAGSPADVLNEAQLESVYGARFERLQRPDGRDWIIPTTT
ncbi:MAG: ABC transporter ATP-binding protein [Phycisphaerales bacterium]|nr:ABC transporter ATP-binding protein [Phycisphaerales bacterium]